MHDLRHATQFQWYHLVIELEYPQDFRGFKENDEWIFFFYDYKCIHGEGVGIILINSHNDFITMSYHLSFGFTNNMA